MDMRSFHVWPGGGVICVLSKNTHKDKVYTLCNDSKDILEMLVFPWITTRFHHDQRLLSYHLSRASIVIIIEEICGASERDERFSKA